MGKIGINITKGTLQNKVKNETQVDALAEAQIEAQQLLDNITLFLMKNRSFLTTTELDATNAAVKELSTKMTRGSNDEIYAAITVLTDISKPYAERLKNSI